MRGDLPNRGGQIKTVEQFPPTAVGELDKSRAHRWLGGALNRRQPRAPSSVSVVIPTKNEERNLPWVLGRIPELVDEVVLVDSRSTDRTVEVARRLRPDIRVVEQTGKGKGDALRSGFDATRGDFIVMIDADGSMDPQEIPTCIAALHDRRADDSTGAYELVKGSRFLDEGGTADISPVRRAGNGVLLRLVNALYSADFTDLCYGLIAFRRDQLERLALKADGFEIETEIVVRGLKAGVRIGEVASFENPRIHGESNLRTWRDGSRVLATLLKERFRSVGPARLEHPTVIPAGALGDAELALELTA